MCPEPLSRCLPFSLFLLRMGRVEQRERREQLGAELRCNVHLLSSPLSHRIRSLLSFSALFPYRRLYLSPAAFAACGLLISRLLSLRSVSPSGAHQCRHRRQSTTRTSNTLLR